jgi:ATP-binding cassette subfamily B protein
MRREAVVLDKMQGNIVLEDVSFSYTEERRVYRTVNFYAKPGQSIAIVGPTGCGKTTIINLLMRFYDVTAGAVRVEERISVTSREREPQRAANGMVLQETWLKAGTIRENITLGKPDATEEEIITAAKAARAHGSSCAFRRL